MYYNKNNFPVLILNTEASNIELEVCDHPPLPSAWAHQIWQGASTEGYEAGKQALHPSK